MDKIKDEKNILVLAGINISYTSKAYSSKNYPSISCTHGIQNPARIKSFKDIFTLKCVDHLSVRMEEKLIIHCFCD